MGILDFLLLLSQLGIIVWFIYVLYEVFIKKTFGKIW